MLVRWRPLVFVSSSIRGLERVRREIRAEVEALQLADAWLFEYHGVASGAPAARQYLQAARQCDLFVLLIGDDVRQATRDEYDVAVADNPFKVLPFLFGEAGPGSEALREIVKERHRFVVFDHLDALPAAIGAAVREYLISGEIVRPALIQAIESRRAARREFVGFPAGFAFRMAMTDEGGAVLGDAVLAAPSARYVLSGQPGSGKSDLAAGAVVDVAQTDGRLPLLVTASGQVPIEEWIADAFGAVRFEPGAELVDQYLRDGRVAMAVDGMDDLGSADRAGALRELGIASARYPRASIVLLSRLPHPPVPTEFRFCSVLPLTSPQLDELSDAVADPGIRSSKLDPKLLDLIKLPFWAALVVRYGAASASALALLDALVGHRLADGTAEDAQGLLRVRAMLGAVAFAIRPSDRVHLSGALDLVVRWLESDIGRLRFGGASADGLLEQGRRTGLVNLEGSLLRFPHPLVATFLAAEHAVAEGHLPQASADDDLAAFLAALSPEAAHSMVVDVLGRASIFALATYLRLERALPRWVTDNDLTRLDTAYRRLAPLMGAVADEHVTLLTTGGYSCISTTSRGDGPERLDGIPLRVWAARMSSEHVTATCWRGNPLDRTTPEQLASRLILNGFKRAWERLRPDADPHRPAGKRFKEIISSPDVSERLVAFTLQGRDTRRKLLGEIGLDGSHLDNTPGAPHITVHVDRDTGWFTVDWGADAPAVEIVTGGEVIGASIDRALADPDAVAYADLQKDLESSLGSAIFTQATRKPSVPWSL